MLHTFGVHDRDLKVFYHAAHCEGPESRPNPAAPAPCTQTGFQMGLMRRGTGGPQEKQRIRDLRQRVHTAELEHLIRSGGREAAEVYERPAKWTQNPMEAPCATGRRAHLGVTGRLWDVINGVPSESLLSLGSLGGRGPSTPPARKGRTRERRRGGEAPQ